MSQLPRGLAPLPSIAQGRFSPSSAGPRPVTGGDTRPRTHPPRGDVSSRRAPRRTPSAFRAPSLALGTLARTPGASSRAPGPLRGTRCLWTPQPGSGASRGHAAGPGRGARVARAPAPAAGAGPAAAEAPPRARAGAAWLPRPGGPPRPTPGAPPAAPPPALPAHRRLRALSPRPPPPPRRAAPRCAPGPATPPAQPRAATRSGGGPGGRGAGAAGPSRGAKPPGARAPQLGYKALGTGRERARRGRHRGSLGDCARPAPERPRRATVSDPGAGIWLAGAGRGGRGAPTQLPAAAPPPASALRAARPPARPAGAALVYFYFSSSPVSIISVLGSSGLDSRGAPGAGAPRRLVSAQRGAPAGKVCTSRRASGLFQARAPQSPGAPPFPHPSPSSPTSRTGARQLFCSRKFASSPAGCGACEGGGSTAPDRASALWGDRGGVPGGSGPVVPSRPGLAEPPARGKPGGGFLAFGFSSSGSAHTWGNNTRGAGPGARAAAVLSLSVGSLPPGSPHPHAWVTNHFSVPR
ncbi:translation initiation factor IF-2-like [Suncus etruscus]|uniref:translation initiation factor IF-2-like n=1 Tax=Suncus etruscus TaxID=109475 RepID=UPI00210FB307|nr:translation initiation factor IF-2-like [Suncus etruscus]